MSLIAGRKLMATMTHRTSVCHLLRKMNVFESVAAVKSLLVVALTAIGIAAQPAPVVSQQVEQARGLLRSVRWTDNAWGIYLAARLHSDELNKSLVEEFRNAAPMRNATPYSEEYAFVAVLFDGAIEAGITVPAELLEPFEQNWHAPVLILLARADDSENALSRLADDNAGDEAWLAANNLLLGRKSSIWLTRTLGRVTLIHTFAVTDPGTNGGSGGGAGFGGVACGAAGLIRMPAGFPPVGLFELTATPHPGSAMLAAVLATATTTGPSLRRTSR